MDKFFGNLHMVLIAGLVLAIVLIAYIHPDAGTLLNYVLRWIHVFCGIVWIGLLYYFNFVQIPTMPSVPAELKPGVSKYIAPKALFFFRWGAAFTVLTGLSVAYDSGYIKEALTLEYYHRLIGIGMYIALIMALNVWVFIWPAQKIALGIVEGTAEAKAANARKAMLFSRTNTMLSLPMLYAMVNANLG